MSRVEESYEERLKERGLRVTRERRMILSHVCEHFGHFYANELLESLERHGYNVSRATVYRTLVHLVEKGLLRRHELGDRKTFYEPVPGRKHHEHMVCVRCGKILEFIQDEIERLQDQVCHEHGFRPLSHTLQIHGICKTCRRDGRQIASHG